MNITRVDLVRGSNIIRIWKVDTRGDNSANDANTVRIIPRSGSSSGSVLTQSWTYAPAGQGEGRTHYADFTLTGTDNVTIEVQIRDTTSQPWRVYFPTVAILDLFIPLFIDGVSLLPTTLTSTTSSTTSQGLSWSVVSGATGYRLERSTTNDFNGFEQIGGNLSSGTTTYTDSGLTASVAYYYRVLATNSSGQSSYSNVITKAADTGGGGTATTATPTIIANAAGKIFRQAWGIKGTSESGAEISVQFTNSNGDIQSQATVTANSAGDWVYVATAHTTSAAVFVKARATVAGKSPSNFTSNVQLEDYTATVGGSPNPLKAAGVFPNTDGTFEAYLVTYSGTISSPTNIVPGTKISPTKRATAAEARADLNTYFSNT